MAVSDDWIDRMPPKKSNLNNARSREARRRRVERAYQSAEQIAARNAAQRLRTAEGRAHESQEQRDERLRQNIARTRAARERNIARARVQERQRQRTSRSLTRASFVRLAFEYAPDINYSAHSKIAIGAMDKDTPTSDNVDSGRDADTELITAEAAYDIDSLQETEASETVAIDTKPCTVTASSSKHQAIKRKPFGRSKPYEDNPVLNAIQRLENRVCNAAQQEIRATTEDEFHLFALSVAAQLRELPLHIAIATQSKIQNALSEARIGSIFSITLSPSTMSVKTEDTD